MSYIGKLRDIVGHDQLLQAPSVSVAMRDEQGRVLLARHVVHGKWLLPGGSIEPGESPAEAAVREMREETGVTVWLTKIVGVFGGRDYVVVYPNGDRVSYVSTVFEAIADEESLRLDSSEIIEVKWVRREEAPMLDLAPWVPEVLKAVFAEDQAAYFRSPY